MDLLGIGASSVQPVLLGNSHVSGRLHPSLQPNDVSAFGALASPNGRQIVEAGIAMQNAGKAALSSIQRSELQLARTRAEKATAGEALPFARTKPSQRMRHAHT